MATSKIGDGVQVQYGQLTSGSCNAASITTFNITFDKPFKSVPVVLVTFEHYSTSDNLHVREIFPTVSGFALDIYNKKASGDATSLSVHRKISWIAIA